MNLNRDDDGLTAPSLLGGGSYEGLMNDFYMEYDEDGSLALARALSAINVGADAMPRGTTLNNINGAFDAAKRPCKVGVLNGSWYLQFTPKGPHTLIETRGPMRIEVTPPKLRISGDIYVTKPTAAGPVEILKPITEKPLLFGKNWYPQLPISQYSWYFRSLGVTYKDGSLVFKFERYLWNRITQEFISQDNNGKDNGFMQMECHEGNVFTHPSLPQPTLRLTGVAQIGGDTYDIVATKTSPFYRGCAVEVDVMTNRVFPLSATTIDGTAVSFASIYRTAGLDCAVSVDQTNLPEDAALSTIELQTALSANHRPPASADAWRLWLLVGSSQGDLFGLMFDDAEPFREGTAGFFDAALKDDPLIAPAARNKKLGEVADAFLRTLVHEAGHAFNLSHPKHDVHNVPKGTTIMNQTGDVMGFATQANPYPGNITFAFDFHNRTSLIHSPDPQVMPGWKRFGWGHGSLSTGVAEPVDAAGFLRDEIAPDDLSLQLIVEPENVFRGEFVKARFIVTNTGAEPRKITSALNLSQGDLRLLLKPPAEELHDVRDAIIACGDRSLVTLEPGESIENSAQIFYTNLGFTFGKTGRHYISAELDIGDGTGAVARSKPVAVVVRAPDDEEEEDIARLSMTSGVGRAFVFGDYGTDEEARKNLEILADKYGHTDTGVAAALTLANSHHRVLRDIYSGNALRNEDIQAAKERFEAIADQAHKVDPLKLVRLAKAVVAPTESEAPLIVMTRDYLKESARASLGELLAADATAKKTMKIRGKGK